MWKFCSLESSGLKRCVRLVKRGPIPKPRATCGSTTVERKIAIGACSLPDPKCTGTCVCGRCIAVSDRRVPVLIREEARRVKAVR